MRVIHRYLGFFLAGIMAVYALSGIILIFRDTDFLKKEIRETKTIEVNVAANQLREKLRIKSLKVLREEGSTVYFENGSYDQKSGTAEYTSKKLPYLLDKMTHLHKANSSHHFSG
jgi:hypothetical protein